MTRFLTKITKKCFVLIRLSVTFQNFKTSGINRDFVRSFVTFCQDSWLLGFDSERPQETGYYYIHTAVQQEEQFLGKVWSYLINRARFDDTYDVVRPLSPAGAVLTG